MPDGSATTTARLQFDRGVDWPAADLPCAALPCPAPMPPRNAFAPPRATESPPRPGLLVVRTTCLVL
jgi:hypothetical protein